MQLFQRIDEYFIGTGEGTVSDRIYYYGMYLATGVITAFTFCALN